MCHSLLPETGEQAAAGGTRLRWLPQPSAGRVASGAGGPSGSSGVLSCSGSVPGLPAGFCVGFTLGEPRLRGGFQQCSDGLGHSLLEPLPASGQGSFHDKGCGNSTGRNNRSHLWHGAEGAFGFRNHPCCWGLTVVKGVSLPHRIAWPLVWRLQSCRGPLRGLAVVSIAGQPTSSSSGPEVMGPPLFPQSRVQAP